MLALLILLLYCKCSTNFTSAIADKITAHLVWQLKPEMWRANLSKSIREIRFVLKQDAPHHGVWWETLKSSRTLSAWNCTKMSSLVVDNLLMLLQRSHVLASLTYCPFSDQFCRHFVRNELPLLKALNPRTHFHVAEIHPSMKSDSSVYFIFGDSKWNFFLRMFIPLII